MDVGAQGDQPRRFTVRKRGVDLFQPGRDCPLGTERGSGEFCRFPDRSLNIDHLGLFYGSIAAQAPPLSE